MSLCFSRKYVCVYKYILVYIYTYIPLDHQGVMYLLGKNITQALGRGLGWGWEWLLWNARSGLHELRIQMLGWQSHHLPSLV